MRQFFAVLLLIAAAIHPFAHVAHDASPCPCVHGAVVSVEPPLAGTPAAESAPYAARTLPAVAASLAGQIPTRAPPAA